MGKKVLVVGSGGREHALAWKLSQSPDVDRLYTAPGNGGTAQWHVPIPAYDIERLVEFALDEGIDLTVVGPEEPLSLGIVDAFQEAGLRIFGPTKAAARLESSKSFAKMVMARSGVPTAEWKVFDEPESAKDYVHSISRGGGPCVLKADGLAQGKGVIVAMDEETALKAVDEIMEGTFGAAGKRLIIEEYLEGQEVSLLCFCDGVTAYPMAAVQDHKRALDGDKGLNTGGMGTYSPPPFWTDTLEAKVMDDIVYPTLSTMADMGIPFQGVLFVGLILTENGPKVLEYNVRFGDPETQVIMMRMASDLLPVLWACTEGTLSQQRITWTNDVAVCVVMAAPGYPLSYEKGIPLGLPKLTNADEMIFHAGTQVKEGQLISSGGRVLGVTGKGPTLKDARSRVYDLVSRVKFPNAHYRRDIGMKGIQGGR